MWAEGMLRSGLDRVYIHVHTYRDCRGECGEGKARNDLMIDVITLLEFVVVFICTILGLLVSAQRYCCFRNVRRSLLCTRITHTHTCACAYAFTCSCAFDIPQVHTPRYS